MAQPYSSLLRGIVGCWSPPVKGSGGLRLPDLCRGNHGSFSNITVNDWQSSQNGWSINCNTSYNAVINCGSQPQGVFTQPFTMLAWVYNLTASPDCAPMAIDGGNNFIMPWISGGVVNAYWASGIRLSGVTSVVSKLRWQLLAISWTGDTAVIFIDNKIDASGTVTTAPNVTTGTMVLGTYTTGATPRSMAGLLGECATFSRSMSLAEISEIYRLGNGGLGRLISSGNRKKALSIKPAYKPAKPRNYSVIRNRDPNYSTLRQGLVAAYCPSISGQGNVLPDLVGGNHGQLTNMTADDWVSSGDGKALDFDGSNDGVVTTDSSAITTNRLTVSCWLRPNVLTRGDLVTRWTNGVSTGDQFNLLYGLTSGKPQFYVSTGSFVSPDYPNSGVGSDAMSVGQWNHIVGVYDGSTVAVWLNGKFQASSAYSGTINTASGSVTRIGRNGSTDGFTNGQLDDVRLYSRALTEPEIKLLASKRGIGLQPRNTHVTFTDLGVQKTYSVVRVKETDYGNLRQGLVGAWCPSLANGGSGNTLPDVSGYGNHGTLTNMSPDDWVSSQYGRALDFDGTDDNVLAATGTVLKKSVGLTITAWVKRTSSNQKGSFFKTGANTSGNGYGLAVGANSNADVDGDFLNLLMEGIAWVGTGLTMSSQRWEHVAIVITPVSGGTANAFLNGVSAGLAYNNGIDANTTIFLMGGYAQPLNRFFYGQMDDVRTYNRALTEPEIKLLASRPGIGLRQDRDRNTFYQFPSFQPAIARRSSAIIGGGIT